jgi:hypothetical protein
MRTPNHQLRDLAVALSRRLGRLLTPADLGLASGGQEANHPGPFLEKSQLADRVVSAR